MIQNILVIIYIIGVIYSYILFFRCRCGEDMNGGLIGALFFPIVIPMSFLYKYINEYRLLKKCKYYDGLCNYKKRKNKACNYYGNDDEPCY